jgi:hypothetical protein
MGGSEQGDEIFAIKLSIDNLIRITLQGIVSNGAFDTS